MRAELQRNYKTGIGIKLTFVVNIKRQLKYICILAFRKL